ncbi:MAG: paraquat-inducible protein A [Silvibacterium sp.]|nr:paraquat-inducible protein A [Silvibacterium sp.]
MGLVASESAVSRHTGQSLGLVACTRCRLPSRWVAGEQMARCPTCGAKIAFRKPGSLSHALAYLIAAYLLYLPANLLPVMQTATIMGAESDTIMSGVLVLIKSGSWPLGVLVFFASIVVPLLKLISLTLLIISAQRRSRWAPLQRTRLYRLVEFIGRWSMLDVYVVALLVGLVQIQSLATIRPGAGVAAFAGVVVLTMLSAMSFDPRLIWDPIEHHD